MGQRKPLRVNKPKYTFTPAEIRARTNGGMADADALRLVAAIFAQAVDDWRKLCEGSNETRDMNFTELEHAFEHELDYYLVASDLKAETIYKKLKKERDRSGLYGR